MKALICFLLSFGLAATLTAGDKESPAGLDKHDGVPPGLQKKGGVPPGQAKKGKKGKKHDADEAESPREVKAATPPPEVKPLPREIKAPAPVKPVSPAPEVKRQLPEVKPVAKVPAPAPRPATQPVDSSVKRGAPVVIATGGKVTITNRPAGAPPLRSRD